MKGKKIRIINNTMRILCGVSKLWPSIKKTNFIKCRPNYMYFNIKPQIYYFIYGLAFGGRNNT